MRERNTLQVRGSESPLAPGIQRDEREGTLPAAVWRQRWIVALMTLLLTGGAGAYLYLSTPLYTSTAKLQITPSEPALARETAGDTARQASFLYTQVEIIRSTPVLTEALGHLPVGQMRTFVKARPTPVLYFQQNLQVQVGKKDDLISIAFDSPQPQEAADLVQSVVNALVAAEAQKTLNSAGELLTILQRERDAREKELLGRVRALADYKRANPTMSFMDKGSSIVMGSFGRLSEALTQAQLEVIQANATYEAAKTLQDDPVKFRDFAATQHAKGVFQSADQVQDGLRAELHRQQAQLASLRKQLSAGVQATRPLEASIAELQTQIAKEDERFANAFLALLEQERTKAKQKLEATQGAYDAQQKTAVALNSQMSEYTRLEAELKNAEKLLDQLDEKLKDLRVNREVGGLNVRVVEPPQQAVLPSKPARLQTLALGGIMGAGLGIALALVRDGQDRRLRSTAEIEQAMGLPVVGVVPHIPGWRNPVLRGTTVQRNTLSEVAEAFRWVRTAITITAPRRASQTLAVTSPTAGDGKSTFASNLAIALAKSGRRVLLIDADFRKPAQHTIFALPQGAGLAEYLMGRVELETTCHRTAIPGLDVMPAGRMGADPTELLNSETFAETLAQAAAGYDCVLVDSPPVLALSDARIVAAVCDATLLIVRAKRANWDTTRQARDVILRVGAQIMGVIVNDAPAHRRAYGSAGSYGTYGSKRPVVEPVEAPEPPGAWRRVPTIVSGGALER